jgi:hypothetical protein
MGHEKDPFDFGAFLDLLSEVMTQHGTGVVGIRIHVCDGMPWAVCIQFDNAAKRAA